MSTAASPGTRSSEGITFSKVPSELVLSLVGVVFTKGCELDLREVI
jgi:hypothetical protein